MGCAGSKPHHLLSSSIKDHHNHNSPQKGFILFNAKTIEYLKANESDIKLKLVQRSEQKLLKYKKQSTGEQQQLLPSSVSSPTALNTDTKQKESYIEQAVDYVLKYAINDFDIENFKSSNHLSMKQIRKDIMKKHHSSSKLNTSTSTSSKTLTLNSRDFSFTSKTNSFYKSALNTAIDEFGLFIQENFIVINEFDSKKGAKTAEKEVEIEKEEEIKEPDEQKEEIPSTDEDDALKLKEALEVARQNFYKGKMSMVCLNKTGGYVVKEVVEPSTCESLAKSVVELETPRINIQDVDKEITPSNASVKSFKIEDQEIKSGNEAINEFLNIKNDLAQLLNETIELIVRYSTKSANQNADELDKIINSSTREEIEQILEELNANSTENDKMIDSLKENLEKSKNVIEILKLIEEKDYDLIDEKLVQSTLNLDYVNKEFKTYLAILENSLEQQLDKLNKKLNDFETNLFSTENVVKFLSKNKEIKEFVEQIDNLIANLAKKLFTCKGLPHPTDADQQQQQQQQQTEGGLVEKESTVSSLSSPSFSSSSSISPSGSLSPVPEQVQEKKEELEKSEEKIQASVRPDSYDLAAIEQAKSTCLEHQTNSVLRKDSIKEDIAYLVQEMSVTMNTQLNYLDEYERYQAKADKDQVNYAVIENLASNPKSSSSSSDILSSNNDENDSNILVQQFISNIIESAAQKYNNESEHCDDTALKLNSTNQKRMSLDEELLYQLEEVDKKVKYMNETCSENEGDDDDDEENDLDDENFDYDESVEIENSNDERLFHPRRPAKIKSDLRQNRAIDLHEEIKQISNVIQDLVQTINVRNGSTSNQGSLNGLNLDQQSNKVSSSNEDASDDCKEHRVQQNGNNPDRKSISNRKSIGGNTSNIPIRQKVLTKQKATSIEDELSESFKTAHSPSTVFESFVDFGTNQSNPATPEINMHKIQHKTSSASSQRFKSKLPIKR